MQLDPLTNPVIIKANIFFFENECVYGNQTVTLSISNMVLISKVLPQLSWLVAGIPLGNINSCNQRLLTITHIK